TARAYVKVPVTTEGTSGKYYFAVKRSAETLSEAISSGHFMVLDPWWNASWSRKRPIHINNTGNSNALTDYQVMINITYDSDMNTNFSDIRVVNETSGETVPYWIENKSDGSWCKLWFNASYIPASSWCNDTYYLYYGNPSASSASDGEATFLLFDDFESGFTGWSGHTGDFAQSSEQAYDGSYSLKKTGADGHDNAWIQKELSTQDVQIITRLWTSDTLNNRGSVHLALSTDADHSYRVDLDPGGYIIIGEADNDAHVDVLANSALSAISSDQWVKLTLTRLETSWTGKAYLADGTEIGSVSYTLDVTTGYAGYYLYDSGHYADQFIVRKYADPEPTAELGSEEQICPTPIITGNTTYNFGVNYTFTEGSGGLDTDSFNISWSNNTASGWQNGTTDLYFNHTTQPHGYVAIDIWAYNSTEGKLSESPASDNVTVPNNAPVITNTSDWEGDEGELVYLDFDYTDADGDTCTFSTNATKGSLNTTTGVFEWQTDETSQGTYIWWFKVEDGWGGEDTYIATITVNDLYQPTNMSILNESINLLLKEQKMTGLSFLLGILIIAALVFLLLGVLVSNSVLTLMGAVTSFIAMALPIPMMPDYPYFGIALTGVLFLFGIIGFIITFYQWLTSYREGRGYRKWERYFE
ncbi:MAG: hypothetical protein DRP85_09145, partial [Candidatus Makaraimicrobium thalassicum]